MTDITRPENSESRCGFVAIVGRPNVGKSTLLNHILGQKLSITSRKPQTTRHQVLGIKTEGPVQAIYVDTPGMHEDEPRALNRYMNKAAASALIDVDVVVFVLAEYRPVASHVDLIWNGFLTQYRDQISTTKNIIFKKKHRSEGFIPLQGYVAPRVRGRCGVGQRREFFRCRTIDLQKSEMVNNECH